MTTATTIIKVGSPMIFVADANSEPKTVNVSKVTPSGMIRVTFSDGKESELYKLYGRDEYCPKDKGYSGRTKSERLYPYSLERMADLLKEREERKREREERNRRNEEEARKREERRLGEIADLKARIGDSYEPYVVYRTLLGRDRYLTIALPTKPELRERHGDVVMVTLKLRADNNHWNFHTGEKEERVEGYMTLTHMGFSSFGSWSAIYGENDVEVIWECLRTAYNNW